MSRVLNVVATIQAIPGKESQVEALIKTCVQASRAEADCLRYEANRDIKTPGRYVFVESWRSKEALAEHEKTPHFLALVEQVSPLIQDGFHVVLLDALD